MKKYLIIGVVALVILIVILATPYIPHQLIKEVNDDGCIAINTNIYLQNDNIGRSYVVCEKERLTIHRDDNINIYDEGIYHEIKSIITSIKASKIYDVNNQNFLLNPYYYFYNYEKLKTGDKSIIIEYKNEDDTQTFIGIPSYESKIYHNNKAYNCNNTKDLVDDLYNLLKDIRNLSK